MTRNRLFVLLAALIAGVAPAAPAASHHSTAFRATLLAQARTPAPTMSAEGADWLVRPEREQEERPDQVIRALKIPAGATVADVGAGVGYFSWRLARAVGPRGIVYAEDIQPAMLERLDANIRARHLNNVREVLGTEDDPKLPVGRCDLILLVDVYHELAHPQEMLARFKAALKPSGRLVLVEYRGEDPSVPIQPLHKMTVAQVRRELEPAGYRLQQDLEFLPWQHILVFEIAAGIKPATHR